MEKKAAKAAKPAKASKAAVERVGKGELVTLVSEKTGLTKADTAKAVDSTFDAITAMMAQGKEVRIVGFGSFVVNARAASEGRDPRTGETIKIPAAKVPKFRSGKPLKDSVNA